MDERSPLPVLTAEAAEVVREVTQSVAALGSADHTSDRLRGLNRAFDRAAVALFAANPDLGSQCKLGCGACCHQWVYGVKAHDLEPRAEWAALHLPLDEMQDNLQSRDRYYRSCAAPTSAWLSKEHCSPASKERA